HLMIELLETDEPRELEWSPRVEVPELIAVDPLLSAEYAATPATTNTKTTIAAIQVSRIGYCSRGRSFMNPWVQCSIRKCILVFPCLLEF
ncbi:MAG: hypothetical protein ACRD6W_17035, partial [Nitrososphaerales archaeon]